MDKYFAVITGEDVAQFPIQSNLIDTIYAPRTNYQVQDSQQNVIEGNVQQMNSLIDEIESKSFDSILQIGSLEWGRWVTASLQPLNPQVVKVSAGASHLETYRRICNAFEISEVTSFDQPKTVYVDYASLDFDVQELFTYDNLAHYCHWLHLVEEGGTLELEVKPNSAIITGNKETFNRWSLQGQKAIYVDSKAENSESLLFLQNQYCLRMDPSKVDAAQLFNSLSLWQRNRLNEYGLIQLSNDIEFFQVVKLGKVSVCQSTKDLNQEYGIVQDVTRIFSSVLKDPEDVSANEIEKYFAKNTIDRFAFLNSLYSIRFIVARIIDAINLKERIFAGFANDYYKVSLGHEIVEILCANQTGYEGTDDLKNRLEHYLEFLINIEEFVDSRITSYRKQGDSK